MTEALTLMTVHAHPDDEAIGTGGILALYKGQGIRTVLVTATNGEMGDDPSGKKPEVEGHDAAATVALRRTELAEAVATLSIDVHESLDYRDSGMVGWPQNEKPETLLQTPLEDVVAKLSALFAKYRPQVVVTYDANGLYGHPDHIRCHDATIAAAAATGIPDKVYFTAVPLSRMREMVRRMREQDASLENQTVATADSDEPAWGTPDEEITTDIDCSAVAETKLIAIRAHQSQIANFRMLEQPEADLLRMFGHEMFVRAVDRTGAPLPETDLFAGLR